MRVKLGCNMHTFLLVVLLVVASVVVVEFNNSGQNDRISGSAIKVTGFATGKAEIVGGISDPKYLRSPGSLVVSGNYAYVVSAGIRKEPPEQFIHEKAFTIIDISNPINPKIIYKTTFKGYAIAKFIPKDSIFISGNYLYGAGLNLEGEEKKFVIIDISNPYSPKVVGSIDYEIKKDNKVSFGEFAYKLYVHGNTVYLRESLGGLKIIDISNPSSPKIVKTILNEKMSKSLGKPWPLFYVEAVISENYFYFLDDRQESNALVGEYNLKVLDISNPLDPQVVSTFEGPLNEIPVEEGVDIAGKYIYYISFPLDKFGETFTIMDISDLSNPKIVGLIKDKTFYGVRDIKVSGNYAYVISEEYFTVIDISNPSSPKVINSIKGGIFLGKDFTIVGNYLYMINWLRDTDSYTYEDKISSKYGLNSFVVIDIGDITTSPPTPPPCTPQKDSPPCCKALQDGICDADCSGNLDPDCVVSVPTTPPAETITPPPKVQPPGSCQDACGKQSIAGSCFCDAYSVTKGGDYCGDIATHCPTIWNDPNNKFKSAPTTPSNCGNGKLDAGEQCDGTQFGGSSCTALGYVSGTLKCLPNCNLDTTSCTTQSDTSPTPPKLIGDFDNNECVDWKDFIQISDAFGKSGNNYKLFDLNNDGSINQGDHVIFSSNFGKGCIAKMQKILAQKDTQAVTGGAQPAGTAPSSGASGLEAICSGKCGQSGLKDSAGKTCHCDSLCVQYGDCCNSVAITKQVCGYA